MAANTCVVDYFTLAEPEVRSPPLVIIGMTVQPDLLHGEISMSALVAHKRPDNKPDAGPLPELSGYALFVAPNKCGARSTGEDGSERRPDCVAAARAQTRNPRQHYAANAGLDQSYWTCRSSSGRCALSYAASPRLIHRF